MIAPITFDTGENGMSFAPFFDTSGLKPLKLPASLTDLEHPADDIQARPAPSPEAVARFQTAMGESSAQQSRTPSPFQKPIIISHTQETVPTAAPSQKPWQQVRRPVVRSMTGMKAEITGQQILVGRSVNDCALIFPEGTPGVSGRHCSISWDGRSGEFTLTDLNSTYGTYLQNGQKLTPGVPYKLRAGDNFYLGERTNLLTVTLE